MMVFDYSRQDENGNRLVVYPDGAIKLYLVSGITRYIGKVYSNKDRVCYFSEGQSYHQSNKTPSIGVYWAILEALPDDSVVRLRWDGKNYSISAKKAKIYGEFLWFRPQGFDRQLFIPISEFDLIEG
jgi:hypothetical protein